MEDPLHPLVFCFPDVPRSVGRSFLCRSSPAAEKGSQGGVRRGLCFGSSGYFSGCLGLCAYSLSKSHEGQRGLTTASASSPEGALDFSALRVLPFCINVY